MADPRHLVWQVNEIRRISLRICITGQASWLASQPGAKWGMRPRQSRRRGHAGIIDFQVADNMDPELRILLAAIPAILLGVATTSLLAGIVRQRWIWICCPFLIAIWLPVVYALLPGIGELLGYT